MTRKKIGRSVTEKRLLRRFAAIVFSCVTLYIAFATVGVIIYGVTQDDTKSNSKGDIKPVEGEKVLAATDKDEPKVRTNIAIFGCDVGGTRTDVIFVVSFNNETKDISVVSVPRDTKVQMTDEMINGLISRDRKGFIPNRDGQRGVCKINEVHAYAGDGYRNQYSVMMVEDLLGIDIDYYIKFTTASFRYVVDAIGGVEFNVPMDMNYEDPEQGLYVHLKAGEQLLDGDKAEQLVRYRDGYAAKDLKRIEVQQSFMKAFMQKVLSTDSLLKNIAPLTKMVLSYVETDITIIDALKYVKYIDNISAERVTMETIPGTGGSYFNHDKDGTKELVDRVFFDKKAEEEIGVKQEDLQHTTDNN